MNKSLNDLYFNEYHGGVLVNEFNSKGYENALSNYLLLQKQSIDFRQIALDFFDTSMAVEKYTGIYNSLAK